MVIGSESPPAATPVSPGRNFCTHCGAKLLPDAVYCKNCGRRLKEVAEKEPALPPEPKDCPHCGGGPLYPNEGIGGKTYFCGRCKNDVTELVREWQVAAMVPDFPPPPPPPANVIPPTPSVAASGPTQQQVIVVSPQKIEVPKSVDHWSWPALFYSWIWALGIGYYFWAWVVLGFVVLGGLTWFLFFLTIPCFFAFHIYICVKGNYLAYQTGRFRNAEHFLEVERKWNQAVVILLVASVSLGIILGLLLSVLMSAQ